jgi:anti-sigma factor RsiW
MKPDEPIPRRLQACARVREQLDELLERDLTPLEAARDRGHLEACAACAAERDRREGERALLSAALAPDGAVLAQARQGLEARLSQVRPRRSALRLVTSRAATWAGLAAAGLLAVLALEGSGLTDLGALELLGGAERAARDAAVPAPDFGAGLSALVGAGEG